MSVIPFLAAQVLLVASLPVAHFNPPPAVLAPNLRGVAAPGPAAPEPVLDEFGPRGHLFYATACEDCVYKGAQCGCQPAMEYLACATQHCHSAEHSEFSAKCAAVATNCSTELDIVCAGPKTSCKGKYHQLAPGGLGLTLDLSNVEDDALCGPYGKCMGTIHMKATIHNAPPTVVPVVAAAPAAAAAVAPPAVTPTPPLAAIPPPVVTAVPPVVDGASPVVANAPPVVAAAPLLFLECGIPIAPPNRAPCNADVDNQTQWTLCRAAVVDGKAGCDLPMIPTLKASESVEAYCLLTEGTEGTVVLGAPPTAPKRLTQPAWHVISNAHDAHDKSKKTTDAEKEDSSHDSWFMLPGMAYNGVVQNA